MVWVLHEFEWLSDLTDFFLGRVVIPRGYLLPSYRAEWMDRVLLLVMYAVYELRRSSSLLTPSAVALGEGHTPTLHDPRGVASSAAGNLRNLCNLWMKSAAGKSK